MNTNTTSSREAGNMGKDQASGFGSQARDAASDAMSKAGDVAQQAAGQARQAASSLADTASEKINGVMGTQLASGADFVKNLAMAAKEAANHLDRGNPQFAGMIRNAADAAEQFSGQIRDTSLEDMMHVTADFARRQPALFFGGAVAAGFLLARFAKSSSGGMSAGTRMGSYNKREGSS